MEGKQFNKMEDYRRLKSASLRPSAANPADKRAKEIHTRTMALHLSVLADEWVVVVVV